MPAVKAWESFYVIVGSSAAALTGLQFVVIALGADSSSIGSEESVQAFGTPTVVHFCAVLLVSAILSAPGHTPQSLGVCFSAAGALGLAYSVWVIRKANRQAGYAPVFEDWLFHAALPLVAYLAIFVSGVVAFGRPSASLYIVAASAILLLYTGIHNAWDAAVYMSQKKWEAGEKASNAS